MMPSNRFMGVASDDSETTSTDNALLEEDLRFEALGGRGARLGARHGLGAAERLLRDDVMLGGVDDDEDEEDGDFKIHEAAASNVTVLRGRLKEAKRECRHYQQEARLHREESDRLRRREVEMMALSTQLHHRFQSLQLQVDQLKSNIRLQLMEPVTDSEYRQLEQVPEGERDLIATLRLGIYQQLGSMRASRDTAVRRASEIAVEVESLQAKYRQCTQDLADMKCIRENEENQFKRQLSSFEHRASHVAELTGRVQDLETKLKSAYVDQEQVLQAKLTLTSKANELARAHMQIKELEGDVQHFKSEAQCSEQKLDILKSEFYDLRLKYHQRVAELEGQVKLNEERLKSVEDLETEAEAFLANIAASTIGDDEAGGTRLAALERYAVIPTSRKTHHAITVTKRCLQLDNQLTLTRTELQRSEDRCARLEKSLEMCRAALSQQHAPFALAEEAMERLAEENAVVVARNDALRSENEELLSQVQELRADLEVMARHRTELVRIRELLRQMGAPERLVAPSTSGPSPTSTSSPHYRNGAPPPLQQSTVMASFASVSSASTAAAAQRHATSFNGLDATESFHRQEPQATSRSASPKFAARQHQAAEYSFFGREADGSVAVVQGLIEI